MISILAKLFIKENSNEEKLRRSYVMLCSGAGIALNIILFLIKYIAGTLSGAISVTADAFNNLSDSGSSVMTMLGIRIAEKKPDPGHPFGHGRVEYLSGLAVSVLIIIMGVELLISSVKKIINPEPIEDSTIVLVILGVSVLVKFYMFLYNKRFGRIYNSSAMTATAFDSVSDALSTTVVLICMLVSRFTGFNADAYCGTAVSLFILVAGIKSAYETVQPLLGMPPEKSFTDEIERTVLASGKILGIHDLIVHDYGPGRRMISLHAEVPCSGDILELHDEIDNVERTLSKNLNCHAVIHMDPIQTDDETVNALKELTLLTLHDISPEIKMHDFRVVTGTTHTNLIFDVLVSHSFFMSDDELKSAIDEKIKQKDKSLCTVVTVDKDFASAD